MEMVIDTVGRLMIPKEFRDALGLLPGTTADVSIHGHGLQILPGQRRAQVVRDGNGRLVGDGDGSFTDAQLFAMIDAGRR